MSVAQMRAYGKDVDDCPTIFTRYGERRRSSLISDGHKGEFNLKDGLQILYIRKSD